MGSAAKGGEEMSIGPGVTFCPCAEAVRGIPKLHGCNPGIVWKRHVHVYDPVTFRRAYGWMSLVRMAKK